MDSDTELANNHGLKDKVHGILTDRTKVNGVVDIIDQMNNNTNSVLDVLGCIQALEKLFTSFVTLGECSYVSKVKEIHESEDAGEIYSTWLNRNYHITVERLLEFLQSESKEIKEQSLSSLMKFVQTEGEKASEMCKEYSFPNELFMTIVQSIVDSSNNNELVVKHFKQYLCFNDVSYYSLKCLKKITTKFSEADQQHSKLSFSCFAGNVFNLLRHVTFLESDEETWLITPSGQVPQSSHNVHNRKSYQKVFSAAWISFLSLSLDVDVHRKVLVILHESVMPHLLDPKLLMDFLTDSYNVGGVTSILSLNSLFILIHQYNLDYPDFYKKLYSLFNVDIFHMKYSARFFHLADLFLASTHLPAYLVAAFIKRLARLALRAPPSGVALSLVFISNLIKRHPNCKVLIQGNKTKGQMFTEQRYMEADPFIESEPNPDQCQALESSLWEIESLRHHYYPGVRTLVELFDKPLGKHETDISEYFDSTYQSLFQEECVEFTKSNAFVEFHVPKKLCSETMDELWHVK